MRITRTATPDGSVYRFYRRTENFNVCLRPLIPLLLESGADVLIGDSNGEPGVLLTVGPVGGAVEAALLRQVRQYLETS